MVRLWGGGRYDLTEDKVEGYWVRAISEGSGGVDNDQCLEDLMAQRWRCDEEEQLLEVPDALIRKGHTFACTHLVQIDFFPCGPCLELRARIVFPPRLTRPFTALSCF